MYTVVDADIPEPRLSKKGFLVLSALGKLEEDEWIYGFQLMDITGLKSGTLYPLLKTLKANGWVDSFRENESERSFGRPLRTYYSITSQGRLKVRDKEQELQKPRPLERFFRKSA